MFIRKNNNCNLQCLLEKTIIAIYNENEKCLLEKYNNCNLQCL